MTKSMKRFFMLIPGLLLFLSNIQTAHSQIDQDLIESVVKKFSIDVGLKGYIQAFLPEDFEHKREDTFFYTLHVQGITPGNVKIRWSHLDAHYGYWNYHNNYNTDRLDKISLSLERELPFFNHPGMKIQSGYIDDFTYAQGLTLSSHYTFGHMLDLKWNRILLSVAYLNTSIGNDDYALMQLQFVEKYGIDIIVTKDENEKLQFIPGIELSIPLFRPGIQLIGEFRDNLISNKQREEWADLSFADKLAFLYGLQVHLGDPAKNNIKMRITYRVYGEHFNDPYVDYGYNTFQDRFPEVMHTRYDNWKHYLHYAGKSEGLSGSLIFDQYFLGKFCLHCDVEWVKINWKTSDKNEEKTFFDCALKYLYDDKISISLGLTNKFILGGYDPLYLFDGCYPEYYKTPLFIQTGSA